MILMGAGAPEPYAGEDKDREWTDICIKSISRSSFYVPALFNRTASLKKVERTFIMVKPDGVQRGLVGDIIHRFEKRGFKMVAGKMTMATEDIIRTHYARFQSRSFFAGILKFFATYPVFVMVWEAQDAVRQVRLMLGDSHPDNCVPGTIRGDYSLDLGRDVCHASDSVEAANSEISLWFRPEEVVNYTLCTEPIMYEFYDDLFHS
ncbi:nucleoside diphosphate kinase A 2-like [Lytechinus variegatus]|uniref:nucleoside diphosphate kinase A 2-like n=1 Tax=Lytechinus variegatus TaxID=7654 RepID=UPI001BB17465|nr:nucleoside diphosphate kinase A 2-like [Lytechinus variegatus]